MTHSPDEYLADEVAARSFLAEDIGVRTRDLADATALSGTSESGTAAPVLLLDRGRPGEDSSRSPGVRAGGRSRYSTRRLVGLDGLRAIAVLSVVVFHLDFSLAPGGFLGVDVFFVISGFLITNLLATEIIDTGRLRLRRFYIRRARRLLPTVLALLVAVSVAAHSVWRDQLATFTGGAVSSLSYVTNWWLIADHQSYFSSTGRPSMFQHLWSLAIEEQFYLVWPAVVVVVTGVLYVPRLSSRHPDDPARRLEPVVLVALALAATATAAMAIYAVRADLPYGGSTSRVYFGSDTHSTGLFLGSAAGAWWALGRHGVTVAAKATTPLLRLTDVLGGVAVVALAFQFFDVNEFTPQLFRGGFLTFDAIALLAILCAIRRGSLFGRLLDMRPIRWLGRRSYSIYVWHWPVAVVTRPGLDVPGPVFLVNVGRLILILSLSALSYHFVEVPLRSGQFAKWRGERRTRTARRGELIATSTTLVLVLAIGWVANPVDASHPPTITQSPRAVPVLVVPPTPRSTRPGTHPRHHHHTSPRSVPSQHARKPSRAKPSLSAFGDSVLLGAGPSLRTRTRRLDLDAVEGRQAYDVLNDVTHAEQRRSVRPDVLIHVGNNGIISPGQLSGTLHALSDRRRVVLVNDRVVRDWADLNNQTIRTVGARFRNVVIVDWHALSAGHESWLYRDGLHLTSSGVAAYTAIVLKALKH